VRILQACLFVTVSSGPVLGVVRYVDIMKTSVKA